MTMSSSLELEDLPPEALLNIVDNLDSQSALKFRKTSKGIRNVVDLRKNKFFCDQLREWQGLAPFCKKDLSELSEREALCVSRYNVCKDANVKAYIKPGTYDATVPYGTSWVGEDTFKDIKTESFHVILPETVKIVQWSTFFNFSNLMTFKALHVKIISDGAFFNCKSLKRVEVPRVRNILSGSFFGCESLETFNAPMVDIIKFYAFTFCKSLKTVYAPRVKVIGEHAFDHCTSLETFNAPRVKEIREDAFKDCTSLKEITISRDTKLGKNAIPEGVKINYWSTSPAVGIEGYTF